MPDKNLRLRLATGKPLLMDGAMGSEIEHRGQATTLPLWSAEALLTHTEVVQQIHADYIASGADILTTNTFRTTRRAFAKKGLAEQAERVCRLACSLAHQAREQAQTSRDIFLAGSIAPLEDCYSPRLTPPQEQIIEEHAELAGWLKQGNVDFLLLETMITARETLSGIQAAQQQHLPFAVSFCCDSSLTLLGGEPLADVVRAIEPSEPLFIGINCVSIEIATAAVNHLRGLTRLPVSVYAQGDGLVDGESGWKIAEQYHLPEYLDAAEQWVASGARVIGGCCGTTPAYTRALHQILADKA